MNLHTPKVDLDRDPVTGEMEISHPAVVGLASLVGALAGASMGFPLGAAFAIAGAAIGGLAAGFAARTFIEWIYPPVEDSNSPELSRAQDRRDEPYMQGLA